MRLIIFMLATLLTELVLASGVVGVGVREDGANKSFVIGDFNSFSPFVEYNDGITEPYCKYGAGRGQLQIGAPTSVFMESNSGFMTTNEGLAFGVEPSAGTIEYRDTLKATWRPGISAGYVSGAFYAGPRLLYTVSNTPDIRSGLGLGTVIQYDSLMYWENPGLKVYSLNLNHKISVEKRVQFDGDVYFLVLKNAF